MAYTFAHPSSLPQSKVDFIASFYEASDSRQVERYLSFLTDDVDFIMGVNAVKGIEAVRKIRETMWGGVETRHHRVERVFVSGTQRDDDANADDQLMLHGTVSYGLKNGTKVENVEWAAKMVFARPSIVLPSSTGRGNDDQKYRMSRYQVWLDGTPLSTALRNQAVEMSS
ncbi:hypothetical protein JCM10212_002173 [Sporobolomyces blumeae]